MNGNNGNIEIGKFNDDARILFNPKTNRGAIVTMVIENGIKRMDTSDNSHLDRAELQGYLQNWLMSDCVVLTKEGEHFLGIYF